MRLESLLGRSALYEVWLASGADGRPLAAKLPRADRPAHAALARLRHEHAVLQRLCHPHVVRTFGLIPDGGRLALATELLPGGDLVALAGASPRHWLGALREVLHALRYLHGAGWVHRDVKARNVLLDAQGRARLIDFGSAAPFGARPGGGVTAEHARPGAAGEPAGAADDAYAFAALLYELRRGPLPAPSDAGGAARYFEQREPVLGPLAAAVSSLLTGTAEPPPGSLSALLNVIESVAPSRA
jgi:serine/threonine protein kinase